MVHVKVTDAPVSAVASEVVKLSIVAGVGNHVIPAGLSSDTPNSKDVRPLPIGRARPVVVMFTLYNSSLDVPAMNSSPFTNAIQDGLRSPTPNAVKLPNCDATPVVRFNVYRISLSAPDIYIVDVSALYANPDGKFSLAPNLLALPTLVATPVVVFNVYSALVRLPVMYRLVPSDAIPSASVSLTPNSVAEPTFVATPVVRFNVYRDLSPSRYTLPL